MVYFCRWHIDVDDRHCDGVGRWRSLLVSCRRCDIDGHGIVFKRTTVKAIVLGLGNGFKGLRFGVPRFTSLFDARPGNRNVHRWIVDRSGFFLGFR